MNCDGGHFCFSLNFLDCVIWEAFVEDSPVPHIHTRNNKYDNKRSLDFDY